MRPRLLPIALVAAAALAGCQKPDVGAACTLSWGTDPALPPPTPRSAAGDYFETGNVGCDDLVCIVSPAADNTEYGRRCTAPGDAACGYCSKPCVSNQDCFSSETGLVCDLLLPDPAFLASLDEVTRARYLADTQFSSFCVVPR
jgi:hypothetical protein